MKKYIRIPYVAPILFGALILFVGIFVTNIFDLDHQFPFLDKVYHTLGGVALGWFFYTYFFLHNKSFVGWRQIFLTVAAVCLVGVFWEYAERLSTLYAPSHARWLYQWFNGGNFNDTLLDLLADMAGGAIFFLYPYFKKAYEMVSPF